MIKPNEKDEKYKLEEITKFVLDWDVLEYVSDLEDYTAELEKKVEQLKMAYRTRYSFYEETYEALEKACNELELSNEQLRKLDHRYLPMTKEDWMKQLLKTTKVDN